MANNNMIFYLMCVAVIAMLPTDACAYLDPSSGGIIIQLLIGGAVGALAVLRIYWVNLSGKMKKIFAKGKK